MLYAYSEATVPKVTLVTRKSYGGSYLAMCSQDLGADQVFACPLRKLLLWVLVVQLILSLEKILKVLRSEAKRQEVIKEYEDQFATPYPAAERGFVDMVIEPAQSRPLLINAFEMLATKRETALPRSMVIYLYNSSKVLSNVKGGNKHVSI